MDIKTELRELMDTLKISMTYVSTGTGIAVVIIIQPHTYC